MSSIRHGHGIHCLHTLGWQTHNWCQECRNHLHNTAQPDRPVSQWEPAEFDSYERELDTQLAYNVLRAMESGEIPISPLLAEFDLSSTFVPRIQPSTN